MRNLLQHARVIQPLTNVSQREIEAGVGDLIHPDHHTLLVVLIAGDHATPTWHRGALKVSSWGYNP